MEPLLQKAFNSLIDWGPGMLIAALMLYGLYKFFYGVFKDIGLKVANASEEQAKALSLQAQSLDRLTKSLDEYVSRDRSEYREIIILQKVILDRIENLKRDQT